MKSFFWTNNFTIEKFFFIEFLGAFFITVCFLLINERKTDDGLFAYIMAASTAIMIISFG